eukprot:gene16588-biopygen21810
MLLLWSRVNVVLIVAGKLMPPRLILLENSRRGRGPYPRADGPIPAPTRPQGGPIPARRRGSYPRRGNRPPVGAGIGPTPARGQVLYHPPLD